MTARKRQQTFVDHEVQGGILRKIACHWGVFFVCNAIGLFVWVKLFEIPEADWRQTGLETIQRFFPFFVISIALIPAFTWDTLKLTHRFAGPILRLRSALADAAAGRPVAPLRFRSHDYWQRIAEDFNTMLQRRERPAIDDVAANHVNGTSEGKSS